MRATGINDAMKIAAANAIAELARERVPEEVAMAYGVQHSFGPEYIIPAPSDPRLMELVREAAKTGEVSGRFADIGEAVQTEIGAKRGTPIAMNIDGATAVIFCELGFPPPLWQRHAPCWQPADSSAGRWRSAAG